MKTLLIVGSLIAASWLTDASASTYRVHTLPQDRALVASSPLAPTPFAGADERGAGRSAFAPVAPGRIDENLSNANGS